MNDVFKVYLELKEQKEHSVGETAFINTIENIAKLSRYNKQLNIKSILEDYNHFFIQNVSKKINSTTDKDCALHALLNQDLLKIDPQSIEDFYTEHINTTKTKEAIRSMDSIVGYEVRSLNQEKFELSEKDFIARLNSTLSKLEERKHNFMKSMDIRSEKSRSEILA